MKIAVKLTLILLIIQLDYSCKQKYDDCDGVFYRNIEYLGKSLGSIDFLDSTSYWVNRNSTTNKLTLRNEKGFVSPFEKYSKYKRISSQQKIDSKKTTIKGECYDAIYIDYMELHTEYEEYASINLPYKVIYSRSQIPLNKLLDTIPYVKVKEQLFLSLIHSNNHNYRLQFEVNFNSNNLLPNQRYQDTMELLNKKFYRVFSQIIDTNIIDKNFAQPIGLYYNQLEGFLGFFLNNGEVWIKD